MELSTSLIRCLLAVLALSENYPHVASKDVAHLLGVKKPTVHHTLKHLRDRGLISKELYGDVHLTEQGLVMARRLDTRRDDLSMLFAQHFGLPMEECTRAALVLMGTLAEDSLLHLQTLCPGTQPPPKEE